MPVCSHEGTPTCTLTENLFDDEMAQEEEEETVWRVGKWRAEEENDFVTVSFSAADDKQHIAFVEVTRVEVREWSEVESGGADSVGKLELLFSDGKTQYLHLKGHVPVASSEEAALLPPPERGSGDLQVFYIEPAVTHTLTIRVPRLSFEEQVCAVYMYTQS